MKMKRILALLIVAASIISLAACKAFMKDNSSDGNGGGQGGAADGVLYAPGVTLNIIYADEDIAAEAIDIFYEIAANTTEVPILSNDSAAVAEHELCIGETNREISKKAYSLLDRVDRDNNYQTRYVIYSDGSSVAIAFDKDEYGTKAAFSEAYAAFRTMVENKSTFEISVGTLKSGFIDPIDYQARIDDAEVSEMWVKLEIAVKDRLKKVETTFFDVQGNEVTSDEYAALIVAELKNLYALYTDDVILWFANLYEPNGGGYYFSNSARNTVGYLPDLESTWQAWNFIIGSGMADSVGGSYTEAIPEWMRAQLVSFIKGLQDENGFFYHPQWGKELTDSKLARRSRDLEWACGMLSRLGAKPTYDTPSGTKGDGILADGTPLPTASSLTERLGGSTVSAVSKVVPTDSTAAIPDNLVSAAAFREYLEKLDIRNNCYGGGNELSTQGSQIKERDRQLKAIGANWSPVDMVVEYLNENAYPTTGHWSSVADYNGTNGLLKISSLYNSLGAELPYPLEAARSAIGSITTDERAQTICYVYNAWYSVGNIINNLKYYSTKSNGRALAEEISLNLLSSCVPGLIASIEKTSTFRRDDGSFSYLVTGSSTNAQGMPVAVPQSLEGDVNATEIGIVGTAGWIFNALGLSTYQPPIYTQSDRMTYIRTLENLGPVIKDEEDGEVDVLDFEDDSVGYEPTYAFVNMGSGGSVTVQRTDDKSFGKSLLINSMNNGGDTVTVPCDSLRLNASCFVFEFDMRTDSATSGNFLQVVLGSKAYMVMFSCDASGIHLSDISSGSTPRIANDFGVTLDFGKWYHYKIEYYIGTEDEVRAIVYVDGKAVSVTDNYYDASGARLKGRVGTPVSTYTEASIFALSYVNCETYVDNVSCYKTNDIYQPITDPENQPNINIDAPVTGDVTPAPGEGEYFGNPEYKGTRYTYDYLGYPSPSLTGPSYGKMFCQSGMLIFEKISALQGETYIQYKLTAPTDVSVYGGICSVYEFDYRVSEADLSYDNAPFRLDDNNYVRFVKNSDGKTWSLVDKDTAEITLGVWHNIRFEIYYINEYTEIAKIFVDGEFATELRLGTASPFNARFIIYMKKGIAAGTVINVDNVFIAHIDKEYVSESGAPDDSNADTNVGTPSGEGVYYNGDATSYVKRWNFSDGKTPSLSGTRGVAYVKNFDTLLLIRTENEDTGKEVYLNFSNSVPSGSFDYARTVIEFDFYASAIIAGGYGTAFRFDDTNWVYFAANSDGETFSLGTKDTATIKSGEWYNIRFEICYGDTAYADVYVDGVKTTTVSVSDSAKFSSRLLVYMKSAVPKDTVIAMDNLFFGHFTSAER